MQITGVQDNPIWMLGQGLTFLSIAVGLIVAGLALYAYYRKRSRAMLCLGCGIGTLTVVSFVATVVIVRYAGPVYLPLAEGSTQLLGTGLILYAIVLARRE